MVADQPRLEIPSLQELATTTLSDSGITSSFELNATLRSENMYYRLKALTSTAIVTRSRAISM